MLQVGRSKPLLRRLLRRRVAAPFADRFTSNALELHQVSAPTLLCPFYLAPGVAFGKMLLDLTQPYIRARRAHSPDGRGVGGESGNGGRVEEACVVLPRASQPSLSIYQIDEQL